MCLLIVTALLSNATASDLITGDIMVVAEGFKFTEGPVWCPDRGLLFSDIPADTIYDADKKVFRKPSGQSNGLTLDCQGRLVAAEHKTRRVTRTEEDGALTVLAETYQGKRLNSPNDVVVRSDGMVFFTDPPYGLPGGLKGLAAELSFSGVYAVTPGEAVRLLVDDFVRPNGLAFSPDEKKLYVADTQTSELRVFDCAEDGGLSKGRRLCELPNPDGIKVDTRGRIWATAGDGVRVIEPDGTLLDTLKFPQQPANCAFARKDGKEFYATARTGLYRVKVLIPGILPGPQTK